MDLNLFVHQISEFDNTPASIKIDYFVYYHTIIQHNEGISSKDISSYFDELKASKYTNIPQYLKKNTKKVNGKPPKFILKKGKYYLERGRTEYSGESTPPVPDESTPVKKPIIYAAAPLGFQS